MTLRRDVDTTLLLLTVSLTCIGVVMVYSSSAIMAADRFHDGFYFLKRQLLYALVGFVLMAFMTCIPIPVRCVMIQPGQKSLIRALLIHPPTIRYLT